MNAAFKYSKLNKRIHQSYYGHQRLALFMPNTLENNILLAPTLHNNFNKK